MMQSIAQKSFQSPVIIIIKSQTMCSVAQYICTTSRMYTPSFTAYYYYYYFAVWTFLIVITLTKISFAVQTRRQKFFKKKKEGKINVNNDEKVCLKNVQNISLSLTVWWWWLWWGCWWWWCDTCHTRLYYKQNTSVYYFRRESQVGAVQLWKFFGC